MWFVQPDSYSSAILAACTDSATMNTSPDMSNKSSMLTSSFSRLENSSSTSLSSSSLSERLNNSGKSSCTPNSSSTDTKFEQLKEFPSRSSSATASSNQSDSSSSLIFTPTCANSSFFNLNPLKKSFAFPFSEHLDVKNFALISVCAYTPLTVYSFTTASHLSFTVFFECISITVESGNLWVSNVFAERSSFSH